MAKTIQLTYQGTSYTLEFTRSTVAAMEKQGFKISEIEDAPVSTLLALFNGAFMAHHRFIKKDVVDKIFECQKNKMQLLLALGEMYNEPISALTSDPEEDEGNASWVPSWEPGRTENA